MSQYQDQKAFSMLVPADYSAKQYYIMKLNPAVVNGCTVAGADEKSIGVLQDKPNVAGIAGLVAYEGTTKVSMATAITKDALVYSDINGQGTSAGSNYPIGRAIEVGTAVDQLVEVLLIPVLK